MNHTQTTDYKGAYINFLKKRLKTNRQFKVVFDASNGPAGEIVRGVFEDGSIEAIVLNSDIDPDFGAHGPNPLLEGATLDCKNAIKHEGAQLGVIFDADGDRAIFLDDEGEVIPSFIITLLLSKYLPLPFVVDELVFQSLNMLKVFDEGQIIPSRIGARFLKEVMRERELSFGAEYSGHYFFKDFFYADSGICASLAVISALSGLETTLSKWREGYGDQTITTKEMKIAGKNMQELLTQVKGKYQDSVKRIDERDGVTLVFDVCWVNVRASNTEPILRIIAGGDLERERIVEDIVHIMN